MWSLLHIFCLLVCHWLGSTEGAQPDCPANQSNPLSIHDYLLSIASIPALNALDGPKSATNVPIRTSTLTWTEAELRYYNYFSAAMYCPSILHDLTCCL